MRSDLAISSTNVGLLEHHLDYGVIRSALTVQNDRPLENARYVLQLDRGQSS